MSPAKIRTIPYEELKKDLAESLVDIGLCERALQLGLERGHGGPEGVRLTTDPAERKAKNEGFVRAISEELKRRGRDLEGPFPMDG